MRTLYLDIFSGISGDMFIGALLDLGVESRALERELKKLSLDGYHLHVTRQHKASIEGVRFDVHLAGQACGNDHSPALSVQHNHDHPHSHQHEEHAHAHDPESRNFSQIQQLIRESALSEWVKDKAVAVFRRVAIAEGKIHGLPPEQVHFHEVGAVDSIVDIVGGCISLELLGRPRVLAASVVEGTGWVSCAHGRFPVPTTATLEILGARGIPVTQCEEPHELVTPTGAAILAEFAESFAPMQNLVAHKVGYGLGTRDNKTRPNVLRAVLGDSTAAPEDPGWETDTVAVLETNLDDLSGELLGHFVESTLRAGALDVFHTPIQMKKNRPGVLLTVLCQPTDAERLTERMLRHTSAFGVRRSYLERRKLHREIIHVSTEFGPIPVKIGTLGRERIQIAPEFDACRDKAVQAGVPVAVVYDAAKKALSSGGA
ncbi:MAG TPA: nickel pincer cofactor biosynthesis protein LarC [Verrucomicrobiales bacterium]|nr:nickel pincer cofactor biosynthesis protein LarC [Verrucomicrobiales bacterium]